ncbi:TPA: host cell division inhibitor Icd-like protein [Escherichia coli]|nr:host cell division inhibitor Icd-like protein [Escherichia coli]EGW90223.1 icd-like protein [Escherichia coli STEC_DG131-3]EEX3419257.1 host cell division inhibitor Icd-like protein [Escherichia coli]EEZ2002022.1 host cell division inhibitor Icd-like protein [Escherichia coli]EFA6756921.1 host cell division inhibitor Icd-like protein [Escherichia coli]
MNITKSAPLPERPCEQLTCCALCVCDPKHKHGNDSRYQAGGQCNYPLGSMPRCCNSLRIIRFIQAARESSPSCCCAFSIFSRKSGSKRNWNGGLPRLSFLCIDTLITPHVMYLCVLTHYTQSTQKAKPAGAMNTNGLLTKPLIEVTIMAIKEHSLLFIHTQTPRKQNNPFHSSVLCTHPGGRFLPDLSRRGYLSTKSSRANFSGGTKRGAGGGIFVLVSSSSSLAQASDCLCRMISSSCVCVSCIGDSVLLVMILPCKAMRRSTSHHGADSDYSDSLALRRWRRLISPRMAVTINCAVLSPVSFTCSIASTTSCGARACNFCDLLLIWSLSISGSLCDYWNPVYTKKTKTKRLKWIPLSDYTGIQLSVYHSMQTRQKRIAVLSQPLTTNDSNSIEVAMRNHITHPQGRDPHNLNKYIWRFIALSTAKPRVIHIVATSEQEARRQSPAGCVMVFTARIRQGVDL